MTDDDREVLRACMIDGFGWFENGDYRKSWLMFEDVDYVFPAETTGPGFYPKAVLEGREYSAQQVSVGDAVEHVEQRVARGMDDAGLLEILRSIPGTDADYARRVVSLDPELSPLLKRYGDRDAAPAVLALVAKLLLYARRTGAVPIVGRDYAWSLLSKVAQDEPRPKGVLQVGAVVDHKASVAYSAFEAGLSARELDGEVLDRLEFDRLRKFKESYGNLLRRHQDAVREVALSFDGIAGSAEFVTEVEILRAKARSDRTKFDREFRDACVDFGIKVGGLAIAAPVSALMLSPPGLVAGATMAAGAVAALCLAGVETLNSYRKAKDTEMAYLLRARDVLSS